MIKYFFLFMYTASFMHAQDYNDIINELPKDALFIQHEPKPTREKPYMCHICFKADSDHSNHKRHMEKHLGIYYTCLLCHTFHSGKNNLRRHQNSQRHKQKALAVQEVLSEPSSIIDPGTEV